MSIRQVARRYAQALADVTEPRGDQGHALEELRELCRVMRESPALREAFVSPAVGRGQKEALLAAVLQRAKFAKTTENFLRVLLRNERLAHLPEITDEFAAELDRRQNVAVIEVCAARALGEEEKQELERRFEQLTSRKVRISYREDKDLIGGVVARWGSEVYDGSIRTQLRTLRDQLSR